MRFLVIAGALLAAVPAYAGDEVDLHVHGSPRAVVEHEVPAMFGTTWQRVCIAPCDEEVAHGGRFRIVGVDSDVRASRPFALPARSRDVALDIRLATSGKRETGFVLLIAGLTGLVFGAGTLVVGAAMNGAFCLLSCPDVHQGDSALVAGAAISISGLLTALVGAVMIHANNETTFTLAWTPTGATVRF